MNQLDIKNARSAAWRYANAQRRGSIAAVKGAIADLFAANAHWRLCCPFDDVQDSADALSSYWSQLFEAFPDLERRDDVFLAGSFNERAWVAATGHFIGTFVRPWLGVPATNQVTFIRFGEIIGFEDGRISDIYILLDIIGAVRQAGKDLIPKGLGAEILTPAPIAQDGLRLSPSAKRETEQSMRLVDSMIAGLMRYDQQSLQSMGQEEFWRPDMLWYGPSGVGATRGLSGFQNFHQRPFLEFVPDRKGGDHVARIADGDYVASGGWPSIRATTSGAPWIKTALPAGVAVTMRVMDFWRRDGDRLKENWVFIDIPDIFRQCGVDVFQQL